MRRGDRVALLLPQRPESAIAYMAIFQMGAVALPLSHLFGPDALEYRMEHAGASVAIVEPTTIANLWAVRGKLSQLEHVIGVLRGIHDGVDAGKAMYAAFDAAGLIQPLDLQVQLDERTRVNLTGLHGIDRERLSALDAETLHGLHRAGYLEGAYLVLASLHNIRRLMAEKQRRLREQSGDAPAGRAA